MVGYFEDWIRHVVPSHILYIYMYVCMYVCMYVFIYKLQVDLLLVYSSGSVRK